MYTHQEGIKWGDSDDDEEEGINEDSTIDVDECTIVELNR